MTTPAGSPLLTRLAPALGFLLAACSTPDGCLGGDDGRCTPASACAELAFACSDGGGVSVAWLEDESAPETIFGPKAGFAAGDLILQSELVTAVFDALGTPHHLAPSGGSLIDLVPTGGVFDGLNSVFQAVGILPEDAVRYTSVDILDEGPERVSLVYRGTLDGRAELGVVTRYELRRCEPGLRVRTEIHHAGRDPLSVFPSDAFFWGDRGHLPFTPGPGLGFVHPEIELSTLGDAFVSVPFMTAAAPGTTNAAYALLRCDAPSLDGFHSAVISAAGAPRTLLMPGDALSFERFLGVTEGPGHDRAIELSRIVRGALFGERSSDLIGVLRDELGAPVDGTEQRASVFVEELPSVTAPSRAIVAVATPDAGGHFRVRVPSGNRYRVRPAVFGRRVSTFADVSASAELVDAGELRIPAAARLGVRVSARDGAPLIAEVVLVPVTPELAERYRGNVFDEPDEEHCAPLLGPPHGASPACNRVLLDASGSASFAVPAGEYYVYATHGPFWSLARKRVLLAPGAFSELDFELSELSGLLPEGALSADLHVHGAASFDSSLPDRDRALSFVASDVAVVVATDHDVVRDYAGAIRALGIGDRVHVMPGVETTGQILFYEPPGSDVPKVVGHFNFWPLVQKPLAPRGGALDDEKLEPAVLFEHMRAQYDGRGVAQLNHPYAESLFGRDEGYFAAVGYDPRRRIPRAPDGTPEGELARRTRAGTSNLDFDVQEVMNGASVEGFLAYRAAWYSLLNQGIVRAATANSDSHTLAVQLLGYPRTVVLGQGTLRDFDRDHFNDAVRNGRSFGTNGPVLSVCLERPGEGCVLPSVDSVVESDAARLVVEVAAAPWIPVEEARIYVNGALARRIAAVEHPSDPFGTEAVVRLRLEVPLAELTLGLQPDQDYFLTVEAGMQLPLAGDLDFDGLSETTDNDEDGSVDLRDVGLGFREPARVPDLDPRFHVQSVAPGVLPLAFSNPLLIDRLGDGWQAPGLR